MCKMSFCEIWHSFSRASIRDFLWCYYRWLITSLALEKGKKKALYLKLFWYKVFVHWKLKSRWILPYYFFMNRRCWWDLTWGSVCPRNVIKKLTAKTVDEDPAGCQRWISRKEILSTKILRTERREVQRLLQSWSFFITIFRLATPADY